MGNCLPSTNDDAVRRQMELEREEGQALLREMVINNPNNTINWAAIIEKANELHAREQEYLRKQNRRERKRFAKQQKRALQKRKQYDAVGSFSVNMLTYRTKVMVKPSMRGDDIEEGDSAEEFPHHVSNKSATSTKSLGDDTHSNGSTVSYTALHSSGKSHDEHNMHPIEEDSDADDSVV